MLHRQVVGLSPLCKALHTPCNVVFSARPHSSRRTTTVVASAGAEAGMSQAASRRQALLAISAAATLASAGPFAAPADAATAASVGNYLPSAGVDDLVLYSPTAQKTPALRAGVIKYEGVYKVALDPSFSEIRISNTQSGNFCMPGCAEPWTEVVYTGDKGKVQLLAAPLLKLTNAKNADITSLGTPEELLQRIGAYITGTYLGEDDLVAASSKKLDDGRTYYYYELNSPDAGPGGPHSLTACTNKGDVLYLFIANGTDKQWTKHQAKLRQMVELFRAGGVA